MPSERDDEVELRRLAYRYARMIDRRDWSLLSEVFTADAHLVGPFYEMRGEAELRAGLAVVDQFEATLHCVMNQTVEIDGDEAAGEIYCLANHLHRVDGVPSKLDMGIRYEDRYAREAGGWRIAERILHLVWQQELPLRLEPTGRGGVGVAS